MNARSRPEPLDTAEVRGQLDRILESPQFKASRRCSDFLRLVVEASAEGRAHTIKERTLGVAIFDRQPDYDTNQDPIVRNTAGQVRKRLAQYYYAPGHESELRIDLPPGSYVPEFSQPAVRDSEPSVADEAPSPVPSPIVDVPVPSRMPRSMIRWKLAGVVALGVVLTWVFWAFAGADTSVEQFWAPVMSVPGPVNVVVGQGHAYKLNPEWDRYFDLPPATRPPAPASLPLETVVPSFSRMVGLVDAQAAVRLTTLLARMGREVTLRGGRNTSFSDLRRRPVVLIGAFNNEWTLRLTGELRFYFELENGQYFVRDRQRPENHAWKVEPDPANPQVEIDYAIVSRVYNATTEQSVIAAAGIKGGGTYSGVEFLTNPAYMDKAVAGAPSGWKKRNAQFVLSTKVYAGTPGPPTVVASHYW